MATVFSNEGAFIEHLGIAVEKAIDEVKENMIKDALEKYEAKLREKLVSVGINLAKQMRVEWREEEIILTLRDARESK